MTVVGQVKHNEKLEEPAGKEGVSGVLESLFSYGTSSLDRLAFQKAQDEIGADISAGSSFSLRVLSENFERGMELLADNLLHPALPEEGFGVVKQETIDALRGESRARPFFRNGPCGAPSIPSMIPMRRFALPETVETSRSRMSKPTTSGCFVRT